MSHLSAVRLISRHSISVAAAFMVAVLVILPVSLRPAYAAPTQSKPTIVLVHGAWADASSWSHVISRLQRAGYTVDAPPNPLRGLSVDAADLTDFLSTISGTIVLVGHSYGGAVISNAALGNPNVKALVYVDAFIPDQGETLLQLVSAQPGSCLGGDPTKVFNQVPYPGAPSGDADLYIKPSLFPTCFANGVPVARAAVLAATQRPITFSAAASPSGAPAWKSIPSWSVVGTDDRVLPPAEQLIMSQRANAHITKVAAGHLSLVTHPDAVTQVIIQAARAIQ